MQPVRYSINLTLDGCCDHRAMQPDAELHAYSTDFIAGLDAIVLGRPTFELMEIWRPVAEGGPRPDWVEDWMVPFAHAIDAVRKYLVSDTLDAASWNAELVRGKHLADTVRRLQQQPGRGIGVGGVKLPLALAELGLIDEYEFIVQPRIAGHGPTLFAGLPHHLDLQLIGRRKFGSGAVALRYRPKRQARALPRQGASLSD